MVKFIKNHSHLTALVAIVTLVSSLYMLNAIQLFSALGLVAAFQLLAFTRSKQTGALFAPTLTPEQLKDFEDIMASFKGYDSLLKDFATLLKESGGSLKDLFAKWDSEKKRADQLEGDMKKLKKQLLSQAGHGKHVIEIAGKHYLTDEAAKAIATDLIMQANDIGDSYFRKMLPDEKMRTAFLAEAKAALDTTTTPLPTIYMPQVVELIWIYGQARRYATVYPLGATTVQLPRLAAGEDSFGFLGTGVGSLSQAIGEKRVKAELISFTASKCGGMIRIPSELETDTFVALGQFLGRYIARQFAKLEDATLFLGDGTATFANISGVGAYCVANPAYLIQLAGGKTKVSDVTVADLRAMRAAVNPAVLVDDPAYYMHPSMEALLRTFNTVANPNVYVQAGANAQATLDGYPIRWVGVMQPYSTVAAASKFVAFFGALSYVYMGERGAPRVEVSRDVYFTTDELAMRALERITVQLMAVDAISALQTAAQ